MNRYPCKFVSLFLGIILCFPIFTSAQIASERPFRQYATQTVMKRILSDQPSLSAYLNQLESLVNQYGNSGDSRIDTIPIVFHVIQSDGQTFPNESAIISQVEALNRAFGQPDETVEPFAFDPMQAMADKAVTAGIYFCLPTVDFSGIPFSPIRYSVSPTKLWQDDDAIKSVETGGANPIDPERFLNIWIGHLDKQNCGYATFPGIAVATDGIVIDPDYFGVTTEGEAPYSGGKTLVHLIGSYLGLYELWNEESPCGDDFVEDTPIHNAPNYGIGTNFHHVSLCDSVPTVEMIINYMDNTDDSALFMITQGQKNRIKAVLSEQGPRRLLPGWNHACQSQPFARQGKEDGINALQATSDFNVFPNPAFDKLNFEILLSKPGDVSFIVFNSLGEIIATFGFKTQTMVNQVFSYDCTTWSPGAYFIRAQFEDGTSTTKSAYISK